MVARPGEGQGRLGEAVACALVDAGATAPRPRKPETPTLLAVGDEIVPVCEGCHKPYRDSGRNMGPPR